MVTIYIKDDNYVPFIKSFSHSKRELQVIDSKFRWIVELDGVKKIVRPESTKYGENSK